MAPPPPQPLPTRQPNQSPIYSYLVHISHLPALLPTPLQFLACSNHLKPPSSRCVVRIDNNYVVKYGPGVDPQEGLNMLFVAEKAPRVRLPKVYAIGTDQDTGHTFIVMEYVHGVTLASLWKGLPQGGKVNTTAQLADYMIQLRALPPPAYIGSVDRKPIRTAMTTRILNAAEASTGAASPLYSSDGPWPNDSGFIDAVCARLSKVLHPEMLAFYRRQMGAALANHAVSFTHGDLSRENVLVKEDGEVVLVDWECAGWLPAYWEFCMAFFAHDFDDDWHLAVPDFLAEWPREFGWMRLLRLSILLT